MKIKLFLTSSLLLLGVWLAAAYNHSVDLTSYRTNPAATDLKESIEAVDAELEEQVSLAAQ